MMRYLDFCRTLLLLGNIKWDSLPKLMAVNSNEMRSFAWIFCRYWIIGITNRWIFALIIAMTKWNKTINLTREDNPDYWTDKNWNYGFKLASGKQQPTYRSFGMFPTATPPHFTQISVQGACYVARQFIIELLIIIATKFISHRLQCSVYK